MRIMYPGALSTIDSGIHDQFIKRFNDHHYLEAIQSANDDELVFLYSFWTLVVVINS